jgi:hypothetical protein
MKLPGMDLKKLLRYEHVTGVGAHRAARGDPLYQ